MINIGAVTKKIRKAVHFGNVVLEPDSVLPIKLPINHSNYFLNGLIIGTPNFKDKEINEIDFLNFCKSSNYDVKVLNGIGTYNIDRSKDLKITNTNLKFNDYELTPSIEKGSSANSFKFTNISRLGKIYMKPYIVKPTFYSFTFEGHKDVKFKQIYSLPLGRIIIDNLDSEFEFYYETRDDLDRESIFNRYKIISDDSFDRSTYVKYNLTCKFYKSRNEIEFKLSLYDSSDVLVTTFERLLDYSYTILNMNNFSSELLVENQTLDNNPEFKMINKSSSTLMYEYDSLGTFESSNLIIKDWESVNFEYDYDKLAAKYGSYTNYQVNMSCKCYKAQDNYYFDKANPLLNENKETFKIHGLGYYCLDFIPYYLKSSIVSDTFNFRNLRSFVITSLDCINSNDQSVISHESNYDGSTNYVEVKLMNLTSYQVSLPYVKSSRAGTVDDLNEISNVHVRLNDESRWIMSKLRYEDNSLNFSGVNLYIQKTTRLLNHSMYNQSDYTLWNSAKFDQSNFNLKHEDFKHVKYETDEKVLQIVGVTKRLSEIISDLDPNSSYIIYGYEVNMEYNGEKYCFCKVRFVNPQVLLPSLQFNLNIKLLLHGGK